MASVKIQIVVTVGGERVMSSETTGDAGEFRTIGAKLHWRKAMRERGRELTRSALRLVPQSASKVEEEYDTTIETVPDPKTGRRARA